MKRTIGVLTDTGPVSVLADVSGEWAVHVRPGHWWHGCGKRKLRDRWTPAMAKDLADLLRRAIGQCEVTR